MPSAPTSSFPGPLIQLSALELAPYVNGEIRILSGGGREQRALAPAVSGTQLVWTDITLDKFGMASINRLFSFDLATRAVVLLDETLHVGLSETDIDAGNVIWTRGDHVLLYEAAERVITFSEDGVSGPPAIRGNYAVWAHKYLTSDGLTTDIELLDRTLRSTVLITSDPQLQSSPRVSGDYVVFESYTGTNPSAPGDANIVAYRISSGHSFTVAGGPALQTQPDIDDNTIVYRESDGGADQLFAYDLTTGSTRQLTSAWSHKARPRISGHRVVWTDDRNGDGDVYLYDFAAGTEAAVVTLPSFQDFPNIDGDRIVYMDGQTGFPRVVLFTIMGKGPPPPTVRQVNTLRSNGALGVSAVVLPGSAPVYHVALVPSVNGVRQPDAALTPQGDDTYTGAITGFGPLDVLELYLVPATAGIIGHPLQLPVASTGGDRTVPCESELGANVRMDGSGSTGPTDVGFSFSWFAYDPLRRISNQVAFTAPLPRGSTKFVLFVVDRAGFQSAQEATITVDDSCLSP